MNSMYYQHGWKRSPRDPWTFPIDRDLRRHYFAPAAFKHPAKMHLHMLQALIDLYTDPGQTILDPMAGSGSLMLAATQSRNVILRDLEDDYVALMRESLPYIQRRAGLLCGLIDIAQADARTLECPYFDHIIVSPPYGFETGKGITAQRKARLMEMGGAWATKVGETTGTCWTGGFRYAGGQNNAGNKSGRNYWKDMRAVYERLVDLMPRHGLMILVIKNHYRRGQLRDVTGQTIGCVEDIGLFLTARHARKITHPSIWQRRRAEQGQPIVDTEDILVFARR